VLPAELRGLRAGYALLRAGPDGRQNDLNPPFPDRANGDLITAVRVEASLQALGQEFRLIFEVEPFPIAWRPHPGSQDLPLFLRRGGGLLVAARRRPCVPRTGGREGQPDRGQECGGETETTWLRHTHLLGARRFSANGWSGRPPSPLPTSE